MDISSLSTQVGMEAKFIPGKKVGVSYLVRNEDNHLYTRVYNKKEDGKTSIKQREKVAKLKNLYSQVESFTGGLMKDYLKLVSASIED